MPTLTVCRVVRTSVLLGPERIAQALKIILTITAQEVSPASRAVCPRLDEPTRKNGYHRESIGGAPRVRGRARLQRHRRRCYTASRNRRLRRSILARPNMDRFSIFKRLIWPSTGPLLQRSVMPAFTAS